MSRIKHCLVLTVGAAAGLFLAALASSATASADNTTPSNPSVPGFVEQTVSSPTSIPEQLIQTTITTLTGSPVTPASRIPATTSPATGISGVLPGTSLTVPGLPSQSAVPTDITQLIPVPMPNLGGSSTTVPVTQYPAVTPGQTSIGIPATQSPAVAPTQTSTGTWLPLPTLP